MTVREAVARYYDAWQTRRGDFSDVPLGHAGEVPEFNNLTLTGILEGQLLQRFLELQDLAVGRLRGGDPIVKRDPERRAGPLGRLVLACVITLPLTRASAPCPMTS